MFHFCYPNVRFRMHGFQYWVIPSICPGHFHHFQKKLWYFPPLTLIKIMMLFLNTRIFYVIFSICFFKALIRRFSSAAADLERLQRATAELEVSCCVLSFDMYVWHFTFWPVCFSIQHHANFSFQF